MPKSVFIIIVNWNGLNDTMECVRSCLSLSYDNFRIVVVDNGSDDASEPVLRKAFHGVDILQTGANLGFAGGNNHGIKHALKENADYIWLLNNDTVVDSMALTELVRAAESDEENGMLGSKILCYRDRSLIQYAGGIIDTNLGTSRHIGIGERDEQQYEEILETGYITGCSLLVKRAVIEKIGLMPEAYFLYFEESEWCVRAGKSGARLVYVPGSLVYHKQSVSTGRITGAITYYMTRNRLYFISRNGTNPRWLRRFSDDLVGILKFIYNRNFVQAGSMIAAYRDWIAGYMGSRNGLYKIKAAAQRL